MIVEGQEKMGKNNKKWKYFHVMDDLLGAELTNHPMNPEASQGQLKHILHNHWVLYIFFTEFCLQDLYTVV